MTCENCKALMRERDTARAEVARLQAVISEVTKRLERITEGRC